MRRILFVDDEPDVLSGIRRVLGTMQHEWATEFATSGKEALNLLSKSPFDVVVSDMRMPEINGIELLNIVMELYPETVRIILTGHSDRELVLRSVRCAHQFMEKPYDAEIIKYTIERTCKLRDLLRNETLKKIVAGIKDLPSFPLLYGMIVKELQSPEPSIKKIGYIISQDVSMSAKILQLVNSAFFGIPQKIIDPQQAAIHLGINTLRALVLSDYIFSSFPDNSELYGISLSDMWRHSLMTGRLAKYIASTESDEKEVAEEALIAGMFHDIGKLILLKLPEQYRCVRDFIGENGCSHVEAEYAVLKTSHAELGAYLLGLWGLAANVVEAVAFHHKPSKLLVDIFDKKKVEEITELNNGGTNSQLDKKHFTGFTTLTAVHVANSLLMQKNSSPGATNFPYVDTRYLSQINLIDKLPRWIKYYDKLTKEEVQYE
jgi:putative nucleotidyltransferase with HDIG domain